MFGVFLFGATAGARELPLEDQLKVEGGACLDGKTLVELVASALERDVLDEAISVAIREDSERTFSIEFFRNGSKVGQRTFRSRGTGCAQVSRAVALLVALGIDAMLLDGDPVRGASPAPEEADRKRLRAVERTPISYDEPSHAQLPVTTHYSMGVASGVLSSPTLTASMGLDWRMSEKDSLSTNLRFAPFISVDPTSFRGPLEGVVALQLGACWSLLRRVYSCVGLNGGVFQARELDVLYKDPWLALSGTLEVQSPRLSGVFGLARVETQLTALDRPNLPHLAGFGLLGLGADF